MKGHYMKYEDPGTFLDKSLWYGFLLSGYLIYWKDLLCDKKIESPTFRKIKFWQVEISTGSSQLPQIIASFCKFYALMTNICLDSGCKCVRDQYKAHEQILWLNLTAAKCRYFFISPKYRAHIEASSFCSYCWNTKESSLSKFLSDTGHHHQVQE